MPRDSWTRVSIGVARPRPPGRPAAASARSGDRAASGLAASRRFTASATRCCWAPSWMSRSSRAALVVLSVDQPLAGRAQLVGPGRQLGQPLLAARRAAARPAAPDRPGRPARRTAAPRPRSAACPPLLQHQHAEQLAAVPHRQAPACPASRPRPGRLGAGPCSPCAAARSLPASGRPPTTSQTCAHSAPVPSASTRAIRAGSSSAGVAARRRSRRTGCSTSYGEGRPPLHDPGGEALQPGLHRVERQRDDGGGEHRQTPGCGELGVPDRARRRRAPRRRRSAPRRPTRPASTRPATASSRRDRRRSVGSQAHAQQCARSGPVGGGRCPNPGGGAGRTGQPPRPRRPAPAAVRPARSSAGGDSGVLVTCRSTTGRRPTSGEPA